VKLYNKLTNETTYLSEDVVHGLDQFAAGWGPAEHPHVMTFEAWQQSDEDHPPGEGAPGYRIVFKTIRTYVLPPLDIERENLLVRLDFGPVERGEPRFPDTLQHRSAGHHLIPVWGADQENPQAAWPERPVIAVAGHEDTTRPTGFVEILYKLDDGDWGDYDKTIAAGRAATGPLTVMLDLLYGSRLLGPILTEEIGEIFDDWHWNRRLGGRTLEVEAQAVPRMMQAEGIAGRYNGAIEDYIDRDPEVKRRITLAAQWYWQADASSDKVMQFLCYWLSVEALELKGTSTDIAPIKKVAAKLAGADIGEVGPQIGKLFGVRSKLAHGNSREVSQGDLTRVRALARAILAYHCLGEVPAPDGLKFRDALGLT
jgi:hypothetical protein